MRDLVYEVNGKIYTTLKEAPKGATAKLVDHPEERRPYKADRVVKIREKARASK